MFNNLTDPGSIVMAGNPVIFTGNSDITANEFPTVLATLKCFRSQNDVTDVFYKEDYTYPLGDDGNFQFDISGALQEAFRQLIILTTAANSAGLPNHTPEVLTYAIVLQEQYFFDGQLRPGETVTKGIDLTTVPDASATVPDASATVPDASPSGTFFAIPGHLTDNERSRMSNSSIASLLGSARVLSRKPYSNDITVKGAYFIYPYITISSDGVPSITYSRSLRSSTGKQTQSAPVSGIARQTYVTENDGTLFPLVFWNRFGLLESATAKALPTVQHNFQSSQYAVQRDRNFHSVAEQRSRTEHSQQQITLSSGIVNREWYEWWLAEVMTTPQLFVFYEGAWRSATIIPDNNIKFDLSKPEALSVEFTIRLSLSGSLYNSFI